MAVPPNPPRITDPERIRALAHPLRLALLDFLRDTGEATATECAAHVEESVASCSFHLRMLEKYGFIERATQRGREKPWRVVDRGDFSASPDEDVPGSLYAVRELALIGLERATQQVRHFFDRSETEPQEWLLASTLMRSTFWATADEMLELSLAVQGLTDRFTGRDQDPAKRPEGARLGRFFAAVHPDPLPEAGGDDR